MFYFKLQQLNISGPSIVLTTSNTQLYKQSLLIQLTYTQKYQDKAEGKTSTNTTEMLRLHIRSSK